jgi:hypothetical protein
MPEWLPSPILYSDFGGDWNKFIESVHNRFKDDFLDDYNRPKVRFDGAIVGLRFQPLVRGKESSFWHLVSTGNIEEDRLPDLDRCECIAWAKAVIENPNDPAIKRWENTRGSNTNICLLLDTENYLVVIGKRTGYLILLTAYFVPNYKKAKLIKEYEEYIKGLKC